MYCESLTRIKVSSDHPIYATIDGVLFNKKEKQLVCYPETLTFRKYSIPQGILSIGDDAFYHSYFLKEISIPESVTYIGDYAFVACYSLTSINLPETIMFIGNNAFYEDKSLILTVDHNSYAAQYAKENSLDYTYPDALDWLNG